METASGPPTFVIARVRLPDLQARLDSMIVRAQKLGLEPLAYQVGPAREIRVARRRDGSEVTPTNGRLVLVHDVTITGASPKLEGGWRLAAVIDHRQSHPVLGWMVRRTPDAAETALPEGIEHTDPTCDHCGTTRERSATFLLLSDAGEWKRVGRQCLRDFLGHRSAEAIAGYYAALLDLVRDLGDADDDEDWGGGGRQDMLTKTYLAYVCQAVRLAGAFVSRKQEQNGTAATSTASRAYALMVDREAPKIEDQDSSQAGDIIAWGATLAERPNLSDYERNVAIALYQARSSAILASAWLAWARETDHMPEREQRKPSAQQGNVGERITRTVRVARRFESDSSYGIHYFHLLEDEDGNQYVWGTGNGLTEGWTYTIKGTVKAHEDYKGRAQTVLTRCKVLAEIEPEPQPLPLTEPQRQAQAALDALIVNQTEGDKAA